MLTKYLKQFSFFNTLKDYEIFCNTEYHAYEICKSNNRKVYFVIDNVEMSYDEFIQDFIKLVSSILQIEHETSNYIVKVNEGDIIKSIHITSTKYYMNYLDNKALATYINESQNKFLVDLCVYSLNQQFRNINHQNLRNESKARC